MAKKAKLIIGLPAMPKNSMICPKVFEGWATPC
jgi:hypothetical protein